MSKVLPKYYTDFTVGIGACAAAFTQHGIVICDLLRTKEREFLDPFGEHLLDMNLDWKRLYDVSEPYGYAWIYFDPARFSEVQARLEARKSFPPFNPA